MLIPAPAFATTGVQALDFAAHMIPIEPSYAVLEYERFLDLNPGHPMAGPTRERLVGLYLDQKDLLRAQRHLTLLWEAASPRERAYRSLQLAHLQERKGIPELARARYEELARDPEVRTIALRHLLWLEIHERRWTEALQVAERLPSDPRTQALSATLRAWQDRSTRSVTQAHWLSTVLPGAGHVYAGDWASGLASFGLNVAWIGLLTYAVADRDWLGGLLVANYGPRYYLGGIKTAGELVAKEQALDDRAFIQALETNFTDLLPAK